MLTNSISTQPLNVPPDFTAPGRKYKIQIVLAGLAIVSFIVLYFGLALWFLNKAYNLFADLFSGGLNGFLNFITAFFLSFLGLFMIKAIFFLYRKDNTKDFEIKKEDEPELFDFICKIADDAKAPRPHRIFLSNRVNASVFYDVSFINLLFPTRKNLEIGLGLVNVLNLGEFKSILAHEFGHFTQRSMIIGRWVYIAHQVVFQIVNKRDGFDKFLNGLSGVDIRIAWVGWILSLIVWSIRSLVEIFFKIVLITQRALSREMEFHADLVSVSLTGSDALVNSLYKLTAAEDTFENALNFLDDQVRNNKRITDIYAVQSGLIEHMRTVLNNPDYGKSPVQYPETGNKTTVFKEQIAQTPKMWDTHPSNADREKNAKKVYIRASIDDRSAWLLFKNPEQTKEKLTAEIFSNLKAETVPLSTEESLEILNKEFQRSYLSPEYKGVYHNRYAFIAYQSVKEIFDGPVDLTNLAEKFAGLYPSELREQLEYLKKLDEETFMLEGLIKKELKANDGKIMHREREITRSELPYAIQTTRSEAGQLRNKIDQHIKYCRNLHYQAAKSIGGGWDQYLVSVTMLIHFCEHTQKNITVFSKYFYETLASINKQRRVDATDILHLCRVANELHAALKVVFTFGTTVKLNHQIISRLNGKEFSDLLEPFKLGEADRANINSWVKVAGSWINLANDSLNKLRFAALDELLAAESYIEKISCAGASTAEKAPMVIDIHDTYPKYDPGKKREVKDRADFYSKFHNAEGIIPSLAKYSAAAVIIFIAVFFATRMGTSKIVIYNGFPQDVIVYIDKQEEVVQKGTASEISLDVGREISIKATTLKGELIESFNPKLDKYSKTYVYNVANSALIYTWEAYYGYTNPRNEFYIYGAKRWLDIKADDYFTDPPQSIQLSAGESKIRTVVTEFKAGPQQLIGTLTDPADRDNLITTRAIWESSSSPDILTWLSLASNLKNANEIIKKRLQIYPLDVPALRTRQDMAKGKVKEDICEEQQQLYAKDPQNADLYYLACRCIENDAKRDSVFLAGHKKWPSNPWLAFASGYLYVQHESWAKALVCFDTACKYEACLKTYIGDEIVRISRLNGIYRSFDEEDLLAPNLAFVKQVEESKPNIQNEKYYAFKYLANGELSKAVNYASADTNINGYILRLAAISNGAPKQIIDKAVSLPKNKFINAGTIIPAIALASKENLPLSDYKEAMQLNFGEFSDTIYQFIDFVKQNKLVKAERLIKSGNAQTMGKMSLLGVLLLGKQAPEKWKLYADKLLYITEKPYLGVRAK